MHTNATKVADRFFVGTDLVRLSKSARNLSIVVVWFLLTVDEEQDYVSFVGCRARQSRHVGLQALAIAVHDAARVEQRELAAIPR